MPNCFCACVWGYISVCVCVCVPGFVCLYARLEISIVVVTGNAYKEKKLHLYICMYIKYVMCMCANAFVR